SGWSGSIAPHSRSTRRAGPARPPPPDMPKVIVDGRDIEFEPGATVIRAAASAGITIPHYCWHPGLSVAGNCRMCLVEVEKMPKLVIACSTQCADGMVVHTAGGPGRAARAAGVRRLL